MDMALYKRVQNIVDGLSAIEEKQNQKLNKVLAELKKIKQLLKIKPEVKEVSELTEVPKVEETPKVKEVPEVKDRELSKPKGKKCYE